MKSKTNPFRSTAISGAAVVFACFSMLNSSVKASTYDWTGATDSNYSTGSNWVGGVAAPFDWAPVVQFTSAVVNGTVNVPVHYLAGSVVVASGATTDITFTGAQLELGKLAPGDPNSDATVHLAAGGSNLTFNSEIGNAGWDGLLGFDVGAGRTLTINGGYAGNIEGGGPATVIKTGTGEAVITSGSTNIGAMQIFAGTVTYANPTAAGGAGTVSVNAGNVNFSSGNTGATIHTPMNLAGDGGGSGALSVYAPGSTVKFDGAISVSGAMIRGYGDGTKIEIQSGMTGSGGLTFAGNTAGPTTKNTLVLSGASTFTGDLDIVSWNAQTQVTLSGGVDRLPTTALLAVKGSPTQRGVLDLNGNNQTSAGISDAIGWGAIDANGRNIVNTSSTAATLTLNTTADQSSGVTIGGTDINDTAGDNLSLVKTGTATQTLSGANTYSGNTTISAGTLEIGVAGTLGGGTYAGAISIAGALVYSSSANQTLSGVISGHGSITKNGSGALTLTDLLNAYPTHLFDGAITVNSGTLNSPDHPWQLNTASSITVNGGALNTGSMSSEIGNLTLNGGTVTSTGMNPGYAPWGNLLLINNSTVHAGGAAVSTISVQQVNLHGTNGFDVSADSTLNVTSKIADYGPAGLTKTGAGTLKLSGANTYTGTTTIQQGTLTLGSNGSIANSTTLVVGDTPASTAVLDVTAISGGFAVGIGQTLKGSGSINGSVTVNGGTLAPGNSIESLAVTGDLTLKGGTFEYEMDSSVDQAVGADLQKVTGNLTLNTSSGPVYLTLSNLAPSAFALGTTLSLFNYINASGWNSGFFTYDAPGAAPDVVLDDGKQFSDGLNLWKINYGATDHGSNFTGDYSNDANSRFINLTAVPEPGSLLALGCLIGSGAFLRSRRLINHTTESKTGGFFLLKNNFVRRQRNS